MRIPIHVTFAAVAAATALVAIPVRAGGDKVALPENPGVLYATVDRPDNKQFRELYVSKPEALEAAKKGERCRAAPC